MQVITLLNEKGGVWKTTGSVTLAAGLALRGARVLLVDVDSQAHATKSLRLPERDSLYRLLVQNMPWRSHAQDSDYWLTFRVDPAIWAGSYKAQGTLTVLPSSPTQAGMAMSLGSNPQTLRNRLLEIADEVDVVVFDTAPNPTPVHIWVYMASDYIIYPTQAEFLSLSGLQETVKHMQEGAVLRQAYGLPEVVPLGVVPVFFRDTNNHRRNLKLMQAHFGQNMIWSPIRLRTLWTQAVQAGKTVFAYCGKSQPGRLLDAEYDAWGFVNRVIEEIS